MDLLGLLISMFPCGMNILTANHASGTKGMSGHGLALNLVTFVDMCLIWQALLLSSIILYGSLPPMFDARTDDRRSIAVFKASVPAEVRTTLQDLYDGAGLGK